MKLEKINFDKEEDYVVFKSLIRAWKEDGSYCMAKKRFGTITKLIESAYNSRKCHGGEDFYTNITYWPQDVGVLFKDGDNTYIYYTLLVNSLKNFDKNASSVDCSLGKRIKDYFLNMLVNNSKNCRKKILKMGYDEFIFKSLEKVDVIDNYKEEDYKNLFNTLAEANYNNLPF